MAGWIKTLWKDSLVYGIGYGVSRFLQIIILPIIAQSLTLSEFGYYSNYVIFYTLAAGFFVFGLDSAVARFFYDSDDKKYHQQLFSSAFFFIILISLISVVAFSFFPKQILSLLNIPLLYQHALVFVLASIPVVALNNLFLSWFKWKRQKIFFLANSGGTVVLLLLPLLFVKVTFIYIFQVFFWSQLVVALVSCFFARDYIRLYLKTSLMSSLLVYGFPWLLVFVFGASRTYLDRFFLLQYLRPDVYGLYNFSVRVSTLISLVITAFEMSFGPLAFSIWNKDGAPAFFARLQTIYIFLISVVACMIAIASPLIIQLLGGTKYAGAEKVLPLLLFAAIPVSLINFSNLGTVYAKKSFLSTLSLFIGFASVLVLNFLLTHVYLQYGAASSALAGHVIIIVSGYIFSRKYYKIPFSFFKDSVIFLLFFTLSVLSVSFPVARQLYTNLIIQLMILALVVILFLIFVFPVELKRTISIAKTIISKGIKGNTVPDVRVPDTGK
jgi:O-antigen/teichoic acid export membrane protein